MAPPTIYNLRSKDKTKLENCDKVNLHVRWVDLPTAPRPRPSARYIGKNGHRDGSVGKCVRVRTENLTETDASFPRTRKTTGLHTLRHKTPHLHPRHSKTRAGDGRQPIMGVGGRIRCIFGRGRGDPKHPALTGSQQCPGHSSCATKSRAAGRKANLLRADFQDGGMGTEAAW